MTVTSVGRALSAYGAALKRAEGVTPGAGGAGSGFAGMVKAGLESTRADLRAGEAKAVEALTGRASLQDVVEAAGQTHKIRSLKATLDQGHSLHPFKRRGR